MLPDTHALGLDPGRLDTALTAACRAPSLHNSQPWRFRVGPDGRHTNRRPFADAPVTAGELTALQRAALDEGAWLHVVDDPTERVQVAELAVAAHRAQLADPAFVAELRQWTAVTAGRADGVPATAGGPLPQPPARWVLRDFGDSSVATATFEERPAVVVLTSHLSGRAAEVGAGQALQKVLLTATADGLAASFLSQLVELPGPRERLRRLVRGAQLPQAVLRIGRGFPVPATPRRPLAEVVVPVVASTGA